MNCYACDQTATNACKRCAKTYCEDHGNATYCADCLKPASAMPSFNLYRGALLVMLIGTAIAVFLMVRPPGQSSGDSTVSVGKVTPTVTPQGGAAATLPPAVTPTAGSNTPPQESGTPDPDTTPRARATAEPTSDVAFREYVVQDGDSLFGIAENTIASGDDIVAYVDALVNLNGWTSPDTAELVPGDTILLPPLPN
jgi:hypothetical protein